jgi:lipoprotein NlpI
MLVAATKPEERCEAQFYLGEWHLLRRDHAAAATALRIAADTCPKTFYEYDGAIAELQRLGQQDQKDRTHRKVSGQFRSGRQQQPRYTFLKSSSSTQ